MLVLALSSRLPSTNVDRVETNYLCEDYRLCLPILKSVFQYPGSVSPSLFVCLCPCLCLCPSVSLFLFLSPTLPRTLFLFLSLALSSSRQSSLSICLSFVFSVGLPICVSISQSVRVSVCPPGYLPLVIYTISDLVSLHQFDVKSITVINT